MPLNKIYMCLTIFTLILHAAPFYLSLSMWGLFILSKRVLYCQFDLHCELNQLILPDLKYTKSLAPRSWGFFAFSVCKRSRTNVCRVSLHKTCSCEISLICSHIFCSFNFTDSTGVFLPFSDITELKTKSNTSLIL